MHLSRIRDKGNRSRTNGNRIQDMEDRTRVGKSDKFDSKAWIFVLQERERERERDFNRLILFVPAEGSALEACSRNVSANP